MNTRPKIYKVKCQLYGLNEHMKTPACRTSRELMGLKVPLQQIWPWPCELDQRPWPLRPLTVRAHTDGWTDRRTDATKCIISHLCQSYAVDNNNHFHDFGDNCTKKQHITHKNTSLLLYHVTITMHYHSYRQINRLFYKDTWYHYHLILWQNAHLPSSNIILFYTWHIYLQDLPWIYMSAQSLKCNWILFYLCLTLHEIAY